MKHISGFRTLNRRTAHRKALYRNMVEALYKNERIQTTTIKAKEIRRVAEKLITKAKEKSLHNIRIIAKFISDKAILMKLFDEIAPRYIERNGGYTRIIKLARRKGDGAEMAYLELIEEQGVSKKKKKKKAPQKEEAKKQEAPKEELVEQAEKIEPKQDVEKKTEEVKEEAKAEESKEESSSAESEDK